MWVNRAPVQDDMVAAMSAAENLARWRKREQRATGGPWGIKGGTNYTATATVYSLYPGHDFGFGGHIRDVRHKADAKFLATARTAMPALRSEESRVGQERVSTCKSRWSRIY